MTEAPDDHTHDPFVGTCITFDISYLPKNPQRRGGVGQRSLDRRQLPTPRTGSLDKSKEPFEHGLYHRNLSTHQSLSYIRCADHGYSITQREQYAHGVPNSALCHCNLAYSKLCQPRDTTLDNALCHRSTNYYHRSYCCQIIFKMEQHSGFLCA